MSLPDHLITAPLESRATLQFHSGTGPRVHSSLRNAALGCLIALSCIVPAATHAEVKRGDLFPRLDETTLSGGTVPHTAGKVTLVDFCASWCAPCKESFPFYSQLNTDEAAHGLVIVAVSVDQKQETFDAFAKKMAPSFALLRDKDQRLVSEVSVPAMPSCYLLGRDGRVRFIHHGFYGAATERELRREIAQLFAETSPSP